ncbi:MAG: hypothetical protein GTN49_12790 [candidate division Zixibacteria bacterium]|nr:hypothetical protein [candidate division Zixibacteria bacterium]
MKTFLVTFAILAIVGTAFGAAGSTIRSFTLPGQPAQGPRGVAYDWSDDNIWVAGPQRTNSIIFGKFNPTTGSMVVNWRSATGAYWVFDIGYGYQVGGTRYLLFVDQNAPRLRLFTTAGSQYGSIQNPFSGGYNEGVACDWGGKLVYGTNYSYGDIYKWSGTAWSKFATCPGRPPMGCATGWDKVFVVTTSADYKIYQFSTTGSLEKSIPLLNWGRRYMVGMSIGRKDVVGNEDSVFLCIFYPSKMIYEVSVGDIVGTGIVPTSLGKIKSLYK